MENLTERLDNLWNESFGEPETSIQRDLLMNLKKLMEDSSLELNERFLNLLAISQTLGMKKFLDFSTGTLKELGTPEENINEARESAAIMGLLNTYYKFKSYLPKEASEPYLRAGLRMQSLMKPANGKELFEQMAFAVSIVNGCPSCIASHEEALRKVGTSTDKIHDIARLASTCKGISALYPI